MPSSASRSASQGPLRSRTRPREHLGARDDEAGADAQPSQPQVGRSPLRQHGRRRTGAHRVAERHRHRSGVSRRLPSIRRSPPPLPTVTRKRRERNGPSRSPRGRAPPHRPLPVGVVDEAHPDRARRERPRAAPASRRRRSVAAASPRGRSSAARRRSRCAGRRRRPPSPPSARRRRSGRARAGTPGTRRTNAATRDPARGRPMRRVRSGSRRSRENAGTSSSSGRSKRALYSSTSRCGSSPRNSA